MNEEQKAFNAMLETYISYEMGHMSAEQDKEFEEIDGIIEHAQAIIAKSLIASIVANAIKENADITMDNAHSLVLDQIGTNMEHGFCEVFKENRE